MTVDDRSEFRLPREVLPRRYDLHLAPDLDAGTFSGTVAVAVAVGSPVDEIVLNAAELEITSAALRTSAPDGSQPLEISADPERERVRLRSDNPIEPGEHVLECSFTGELNDKLRGFYRSRFTDDAGVEHLIATTQFESTDARRAFPCFDEPDMKAVFAVTLDVPSGMLAVSNGPELEAEELDGGRRRVRFGDTIPMSTYLVAFVVGPLEATEPVDVDGVALRVVHAPGKAHLTGPAIEVATHALGFFSDYFGLPYPGEKLDLVAVPDFAAGAMENLGCVTFRDAILLADPAATAQTELERLAEVVEHELAHMWFGDLVTMGWWNGLWLNEAFATFMALRCQDDFRPEWRCFVSFARSKSAALAVDGLHSTRPIEFPVRHPDESQAMFDVLTYEKGAGVLWMLEQFLGEDRFRDGVRRYLAKHAYGNTETGDLWDAIEAEAGELPIRALMDSWIFQGGYPLVHVGPAGEGSLRLEQQPFAYLPAPPEGSSAIGSDWLVPILVSTDTGACEAVLLRESPVTVTRGAVAPVVNAGGSGFYRLDYSPELAAELLERLFDLAALERYNLLADTWAAVLAGARDLSDFLAFCGRLDKEVDPHVWSIAIGALGLLDLVVGEADRPALEAATRSLLDPQLARVGWEARPGEDDQTPVLRAALISTLGTIGTEEAVVERARELFAGDHGGGRPIPADLASPVLAVVAAHATPAEHDAIVERHRHPDSPLDEIRHLGALAAFTDAGYAASIRDRTLTDIRSQNAPYLLGSMLRNRAVSADTWEFIVGNFDALVERFPESSIHRMLEGLVALVDLDETNEPRHLSGVRAFVEAKIAGGRRRLVDQSLERLAVNVRFAQRVRPRLGELLRSFTAERTPE